MNDQADKQDAQTETLIIGIADRARNLYLTRQMLCTEAVVTALNQGLKGGLTDVQATAVSAPFCVALGGKRLSVRRIERCRPGHRIADWKGRCLSASQTHARQCPQVA